MRTTHTSTRVFAEAPCGHQVPVPNDAYLGHVDLDPCDALGSGGGPCGHRWRVHVSGLGRLWWSDDEDAAGTSRPHHHHRGAGSPRFTHAHPDGDEHHYHPASWARPSPGTTGPDPGAS